MACHGAFGRHGGQFRIQIVARRHRKRPQPFPHAGAEKAWQLAEIAKIDDMQRAARRDEPERMIERLLPWRDHRKRIGNKHAVKFLDAERGGRIEVDRVALRHARPVSNPRCVEVLARGDEHLFRHIEAKQPRGWIGLRREREIARRAAADFQHRPVQGRLHFTDQIVASEQVELSRGVVEMPLMPIHAVHMGGGETHAAACFSV